MRIVFFGTPELAVPSLAAVAERHQVAALVCQPDRPQKRSRKPVAPATKVWALEHGIPVHQTAKLNDGTFEAWFKEQAPDLCAVAAYGRLLKQPILDVPAQGWLNLHPSLLPKYRGPSPIRSAILDGDKVTGVTIMRLVLEMDVGDILLQEEAEIRPDATTQTLSERLAVQGGTLLADGVDLVASGEAVFRAQNHDEATYCKLFEKKDGRIDWSAPARRIHDLVRAAIPWPVAHSGLKGEVYRIHLTQVLDESAEAAPGTVVRVDKDRLVVATGDGVLAILTLQAPGKRAIAVADYLRGHAVNTGDRFEDD